MIINDQERNIQNWFEMVKNNKKCTDQMEILDNINEENKKVPTILIIFHLISSLMNRRKKFENI